MLRRIQQNVSAAPPTDPRWWASKALEADEGGAAAGSEPREARRDMAGKLFNNRPTFIRRQTHRPLRRRAEPARGKRAPHADHEENVQAHPLRNRRWMISIARHIGSGRTTVRVTINRGPWAFGSERPLSRTSMTVSEPIPAI
jgi:hypothetical protein